MAETGAHPPPIPGTRELRDRVADAIVRGGCSYDDDIEYPDKSGDYWREVAPRLTDAVLSEITLVPSTDQVLVSRDDLRVIVAYVLAIKGPDDFSMFHEASIALTPDVLDRLAAALKG